MRQRESIPIESNPSAAADALVVLVRLLARQAAHEFAAQRAASSDSKRPDRGDRI
jgi:hypothetical protein